ncbi:MAG: hypothetical protein C4320_05755 [Armatimonadota bacterium]
MVKCACGKVIDRIPTWMETIKVEYVCNNCPNRTMKNIAFVSLEPVPVKPTIPEMPAELLATLNEEEI